MIFLRNVGLVLLALGIMSYLAVFPVVGGYHGKAILAQRVKKDKASDLFGGDPVLIGSPQEYIIQDPNSLMKEKGKDGVPLLDDNYLKEHKLYPTQLKTIDFAAGILKAACAGIAVLGGFLFWLSGRILARRKREVTIEKA